MRIKLQLNSSPKSFQPPVNDGSLAVHGISSKMHKQK